MQTDDEILESIMTYLELARIVLEEDNPDIIAIGSLSEWFFQTRKKNGEFLKENPLVKMDFDELEKQINEQFQTLILTFGNDANADANLHAYKLKELSQLYEQVACVQESHAGSKILNENSELKSMYAGLQERITTLFKTSLDQHFDKLIDNLANKSDENYRKLSKKLDGLSSLGLSIILLGEDKQLRIKYDELINTLEGRK